MRSITGCGTMTRTVALCPRAIASSLALWPGLFLAAGGLAKAVDVSRGDVSDTVLARLVDGRAPLRATWASRRGGGAGGGRPRRRRARTPWPEAAAALLLSGAALVALWGLRHAPDAGCGCFGARSTRRSSVRTAVRAGLLAGLAALAAAGGEGWTSVFDDPAASPASSWSASRCAWLSPALGAPGCGRKALAGGSRARRVRAAACSRRVSLDRSVARLRRSELWRARPAVCLRRRADRALGRGLLAAARATRPSTSGEPATAVFAVSLGLGQSQQPGRVRRRGRAARARPARRAAPADAEPRQCGPRGGRRARAAAVLALAVPASGVGAREARAHRRRPPEPSSRGSPTSVTFYFNEPVEASFGVIRVFDSRATRSRPGSPFRPRGRRATRWRSRCSRTCPRARTRRPTGSSPPTRIRSRAGWSSRSARRAAGRRRRCPAQAGTGSAHLDASSGPTAGSATPRSGWPSARCSSSLFVVAARPRRPVGRQTGEALGPRRRRRSTGASVS